MSNLISLDR